MKRMRSPRRWLLQLSVSVSLAALFSPYSICQPNMDNPGQAGVSMTLYHVVRGGNGAQLLVTPAGQAIPLPGAGVQGHRVAVYAGTHGGQWYVDRNGQQVELPPFPGSPNYPGAGYAAYGNGYGQPGYPPSGAQAPVESSSSSSGGGSALGGFAGGLIGSTVGAVLGNAIGGVPYGAPVYGGGGGAYYVGAGGDRTYINNTNEMSQHFNEWNQQRSWYHHQVNNDGGRYHNWWPGKDHGFPSPGEGGGRLYANDDHAGQETRRQDGQFDRLGRGNRHDGEGRERGGDGAERRGDEHRGEEHHGEEHHGGEHHGGGHRR